MSETAAPSEMTVRVGVNWHRPGVSTTYTPGLWGVYCVGCSDAAGEFVFPCQEIDAPIWPPYLTDHDI